MQTVQIVLGVYVIGFGAALIYIRRNRYPIHTAHGPVYESRGHQVVAASLWFIAVPIKLGYGMAKWCRRRD